MFKKTWKGNFLELNNLNPVKNRNSLFVEYFHLKKRHKSHDFKITLIFASKL